MATLVLLVMNGTVHDDAPSPAQADQKAISD
jgi:hypothetical protein